MGGGGGQGNIRKWLLPDQWEVFQSIGWLKQYTFLKSLYNYTIFVKLVIIINLIVK